MGAASRRGSPQRDAVAPVLIDDGLLADAMGAVRRHPDFAAAVAVAASGIMALFDGNRMLNRVMNDRGRALFAIAALHFDAQPDAFGHRLTAARMIDFAVSSDLCSPGRAKAMLALLRWGGYLAPGEDTDDRRQRPLVPTAKLWDAVAARWLHLFTALSLIGPEGTKALAAIDQVPFRQAFAVGLGTAFRAGFRPLDHAPLLRAVAERDAGLVILFALSLAAGRGDPPLVISQLAARFSVSRAHVLAVLQDAAAAGLVRREPVSGAPVVLPALTAEIAAFFAAIFVLVAETVTEALGRTASGETRRPAQ